MIGRSKCKATEQRSFQEILSDLDREKAWAKSILSRLGKSYGLPANAKILDLGAAAGSFVAVCHGFGHKAIGVEPWQEARENASRLSEHLRIPIEVFAGRAESIPCSSDTFDLVHAAGGIEHVEDLEKTFAEVRRVLRPGGAFWFNTASSMSPFQNEIRGFPLFGWYPDPWKRRIMSWVKEARPHLVGHTRTPAMHWFTPSKARRLFGKNGFSQAYDRWELRGESEGQGVYRFALRLIRSNRATKTCADILVPGCSYAGIKV